MVRANPREETVVQPLGAEMIAIGDRVRWANREYEVLDNDEALEMAKIGGPDPEKNDAWWVRHEALERIEEHEE